VRDVPVGAISRGRAGGAVSGRQRAETPRPRVVHQETASQRPQSKPNSQPRGIDPHQASPGRRGADIHDHREAAHVDKSPGDAPGNPGHQEGPKAAHEPIGSRRENPQAHPQNEHPAPAAAVVQDPAQGIGGYPHQAVDAEHHAHHAQRQARRIALGRQHRVQSEVSVERQADRQPQRPHHRFPPFSPAHTRDRGRIVCHWLLIALRVAGRRLAPG
jgi:hypothetical protein